MFRLDRSGLFGTGMIVADKLQKMTLVCVSDMLKMSAMSLLALLLHGLASGGDGMGLGWHGLMPFPSSVIKEEEGKKKIKHIKNE